MIIWLPNNLSFIERTQFYYYYYFFCNHGINIDYSSLEAMTDTVTDLERT